ncbi:MAG: tetratricopeptide repeat protein [Myxococcales bacterium]|nr:tetratricopeptide repeat protein [Myxococcales bacterium]
MQTQAPATDTTRSRAAAVARTAARLVVLSSLIVLGLSGCASSGPRTVRLINGRAQSSRYVSPNAYHHFLRAEIALTRGNPTLATEELRRALAFDPRSPYLHTRLAQTLIRTGMAAAAKRHLAKALDSREGFPDALIVRAALAAREKRYADAEKALRACVEHNPSDARAYVRLAALLEERARPREARALLDQMVKRVERKRPGYRSLALLCLRQLDYACAARAYVHALQVRSDLDTLMRLAHVLRSMGQLEQATRLLREAFDHSSGHVSVALELAEVLAARNKTREIDDLLAVLERAAGDDVKRIAQVVEVGLRVKRARRTLALLAPLVAKQPKDPTLRVAQAIAMARVKSKRARAVARLRALLAGAEAVRAARELARVYADQGKLADAIKVLQSVYAKHQSADELAVALGDALHRAGRDDDAVTLLRDAAKRHDSRALRFGLAAALERKGSWREAIAALSPLLDKNARDAAVHNFIGYTRLEHGGDLARAEREIRRALYLRPGASYIMDSLGWLYFKKRRYARAERALSYAYRAAPEEPEIIRHLAEVNAALKRLPRALELLRRALKLSKEPQLSAQLKKRIEDLRAGHVGQSSAASPSSSSSSSGRK